MSQETSQEIEDLSTALMTMCCNNFAEFASEDNTTVILNNLKLIQLYSLDFLAECGVSLEEFKTNIATCINNAATDAWNNKIYPDYMGSDGHPDQFAWERYIQQGDYVLLLLQTAIDLCDDDSSNVVRYENMIAVQNQLINSWSYVYSDGIWGKEYSLAKAAKTIRSDKIKKWQDKIKEIDPSRENPQKEGFLSNGCYVATAVYGSYDCPQVWTLRRYRDYQLAKTWYGRAFIRTYYAISPILVKLFGNTDWFKKMWRGKLDRIVKELQEKGYESTPYEDRKW